MDFLWPPKFTEKKKKELREEQKGLKIHQEASGERTGMTYSITAVIEDSDCVKKALEMR